MWKILDRLFHSYTVNGMLIQSLIHFPTFFKNYTLLQESQWWSQKQLEEYQLQQLSRLLHHAYENVPYYTRIFDNLNLKPKDIKSLKDLQKLPLLTKEIIRDYKPNIFGDVSSRMNYI